MFSKLALRQAFHQLELDEESCLIAVFHAGDRLMRYRRLTMGAKPASGELNKALSPIFQDIPYAHVIHDDIINEAPTKEQHDHALEKVLTRTEESGLTLNASKCILVKDEFPFWGMTVTKNVIKPDPCKVEALKNAGRPRSKDEVMSFLCFVQLFSDFIPNLSRKTVHLRMLTKKHACFKWTKECRKEFNELKYSICEDTLLRYFDTSLPTFIFIDAHKTGISAILTQGKDTDSCKLVAFASRATKDEERCYPQLDPEALVIDFGLRRFRLYVVGAQR